MKLKKSQKNYSDEDKIMIGDPHRLTILLYILLT